MEENFKVLSVGFKREWNAQASNPSQCETTSDLFARTSTLNWTLTVKDNQGNYEVCMHVYM